MTAVLAMLEAREGVCDREMEERGNEGGEELGKWKKGGRKGEREGGREGEGRREYTLYIGS